MWTISTTLDDSAWHIFNSFVKYIQLSETLLHYFLPMNNKTKLSQQLKLNETWSTVPAINTASLVGESRHVKQISQYTHLCPVQRLHRQHASTACIQTIKKAGQDCLLLLASHTRTHTHRTSTRPASVPSKLPSATHEDCPESSCYSCPRYATPACGFTSDNTWPRKRQCSRVCNM